MEKVTVETMSGFVCEVDADVKDDYELLEAVEDMTSGDDVKQGTAVPRMLRALLSPEDYRRLKEHCREDGRVSTKRITEEMTEILQKIPESKKN